MAKKKRQNSSNSIVFVVAALLIAAAGAAGYLFWQQAQKTGGESADIVQNDPVVAIVDGRDVYRTDVLGFIQKMPENIRQLPIQNVYSIALDQVINNTIIEEKLSQESLEKTQAYKTQIEEAKKQILRGLFLEKTANANISEERLQGAYEEYKAKFPKEEEVRARHILVEEEEQSKAILKRLNAGEAFEDLAKEVSIDGTAELGGNLGFFLKKEVVPDFGNAAFAMEPGDVSVKPVKSPYGYHIIKVEEKRARPVPEYSSVKNRLKQQMTQSVLNEVVQGWRGKSDIKLFDINGKPIEPASGADPAPAPAAQPNTQTEQEQGAQ